MVDALQAIERSTADPFIAKLAREALPRPRLPKKTKSCKWCGNLLPEYTEYGRKHTSQFCSSKCFTNSYHSSPYRAAKRKAAAAKAKQVKQMRKQGMTYHEIGAKFGITGATLPRFPRGS